MAKREKLRPPNRIGLLRKARKLTQQQLADRVGAHWITISKLERGKMRLTQEWMETIGRALEVTPAELIENFISERQVWLGGKISSGQNVELFKPDFVNFHTEDDDDLANVSAEWFRIEGSDLEPFYYDGDLIRVSFYVEDAWPYMVGRLVVVVLEDGRRLLLIVQESLGEHRFNLRSVKGHAYPNVLVKDMASVTGHLMRLVEDPRK